MQISLSVKNSSKVSKTNITWCLFLLDVVSYNKHFTQLPISLEYNTGRIQCEVLTTLPFCFSWIKKFLGQQLKI